MFASGINLGNNEIKMKVIKNSGGRGNVSLDFNFCLTKKKYLLVFYYSALKIQVSKLLNTDALRKEKIQYF